MKKIILIILAIINSGIVFSQIQIGQNLDGSISSQLYGRAVSLNSNGTFMAIGLNNNVNGTGSGSVKIFKNNDGTWLQVGNDIHGEKAYDNFGVSIDLNSNGTMVAIGASTSDGNGEESGHVAIYKNNNGVWTQIGQDIHGEYPYDRSSTLSLNSDGDVVAIGIPNNDDAGKDAGQVRVFKNESGVWTQIGADIDGETAESWSGSALKISADGSIIAIGAWGNNGNGSQSGHVRVYQNISGVWTQLGEDIDGEDATNRSGISLDLSADGTTVAIGAIMNSNQFERAGHVRVYHYENNEWTQIGEDIDGEAQNDNSGNGVSLSADGKILAIGAAFNDDNGNNSGHVRIYQNISNDWIQIGNDIDGEDADDRSGSVISLSADGNALAIGVTRKDVNGTDSGRVRVFEIERREVDTEAPVITSSTEIAVDENIGESQEIYTITATDNIGVVSYAISGDDVDDFEVNEDTGVVTLKPNPDYETKSSYTFSVTASDAAGNMSNPHNITLNINDLDESPKTTRIGWDIYGEDEGDECGWYVSLSSDGSIVAVSSPNNEGDGNGLGQVRIFRNTNNNWVQIGQDINGEGRSSISLSSDGNTIATGHSGSDINGANSGHVRVYRNQNDEWIQIGQDILGENSSDFSGSSISLSSNGDIMAIGSTSNDDNRIDSGHVRIFQYNGNSWQQKGNSIVGEDSYDYSGGAVSLSSDGNIVAVGASANDGNGRDSGHVRIYNYENGNWVQIGEDIDGEASRDGSGGAISLSSNGNIIAIGAEKNDGNGTSSGHVRIYRNVNNNWIQMGQDIDGEAEGDKSGGNSYGGTTPVSLSSNGHIVAIGAANNGGNGLFSGHVRIYKFENDNWIKIIGDINGVAEGDQSGVSVSLSSDGNVIAIGAPSNDGNGEQSGHVRVYNLSGNTKGNPISNEGLLAHYPFDGDVNDYGGSNYHGILADGAFTADSSGNTNAALELDGVDDFVNLSSFATTYRDNTSKLSVYFKVKFNKTTNNQTILSLGNSGETFSTNVFEIEYENNRLQVETEVGSATTNYELEIDEANSLFDDQWHEILLTFDDNNLKYYKDGALVFDDTYVPVQTGTEDLFLGVFGGTSSNRCCFSGIKIDELQFYNKILDQSVLSVENTNVISTPRSILTLFPNPVKDKLSIKVDKGTITSFEVFNIRGQKVVSQKNVGNSTYTIDTYQMKKGMYFIRLKNSNDEFYTQKFIKN